MLIVEKVDARWPLTAKVRAYCASDCSFSVGTHGFDQLQAYKFTRTDHVFATGDKVLLQVRRPYPAVGEVVDTSTVIKAELLDV